MLYPESNECRMVTSLDGFWNFKVEEQLINRCRTRSRWLCRHHLMIR
ncbi:hypothetical protein [Ligilactobacillus aviarius]